MRVTVEPDRLFVYAEGTVAGVRTDKLTAIAIIRDADGSLWIDYAPGVGLMDGAGEGDEWVNPEPDPTNWDGVAP